MYRYLHNRLEPSNRQTKNSHWKVKARYLSPFSKFRIFSTYLLPKDLNYVKVVKPIQAQVKEVWTPIRQLQSNFSQSTAFAANPKEGGLGCLPLQTQLSARDLKWFTLLFTSGAEKAWVQWNIFLKLQDSLNTGFPSCLPIQLLQQELAIFNVAFDSFVLSMLLLPYNLFVSIYTSRYPG